MMKATPKNTWLAIISTFVYAILLLISISLRLDHINPPKSLLTAIETAYILPVIYLVMVQKHFNEKRSIVISFIIYIIFDISLVIYYFFNTPGPDDFLTSLVLGAFSVLMINVLIIQSFHLKTQQLILPFCVYTIIFLIICFFKLAGSILMVTHYGSTVFNSTVPAEILLPLSMLCLLFSILKLLKNQQANQSAIPPINDAENLAY